MSQCLVARHLFVPRVGAPRSASANARYIGVPKLDREPKAAAIKKVLMLLISIVMAF